MRSLLALVLAALVACGTHSPGSRSVANTPFLGASDLQAYGAGDLYDAVRALRGNWLAGGRPARVVFENGMYRGTTAVLREYTVRSVGSVEYVSESDTYGRFGPRYRGPSLVIELWRRQ